MMNPPAVSVIVPFFNAEKYFAECLDSLLAQTFQDFDVIIVNDCSTDGSRQIAESYAEKFGTRLRIFDNHKNFGPSVARNKGLQISRGEYVFFFDADDLLMLNGLEKMYDAAKKYDADVLNLTDCYVLSNDGQNVTLQPPKKFAVDKLLIDVDKEWRIKNLIANNFRWAPWRKFTRRNFLIENELFFPEKIRRAQDVMWTHAVWFFAEKIVHISLPIYFHRQGLPGEHEYRVLDYRIDFRTGTIVHAAEWLNKIMDRTPFFEMNPQYRYPMMKHIAERFFMIILKLTRKVSTVKLYKLLKKEFEKNSAAYNPTDVLPVLFTLIIEYQKILMKNITDDDRLRLEKFLISVRV